MWGGYGDDFMRGQEYKDHIYGEWGKDAIDGGTGDDEIEGGSEDDWIWNPSGSSTIDAGTRDDLVHVLNTTFIDVVQCGSGYDEVWWDSALPDIVSNWSVLNNFGVPPFFFAPGGGNNWDAFTNQALFGKWHNGTNSVRAC